MPELTPKEKLMELLKAEGMELAEDIAVETVKMAFEILPKVAAIIPGTIDDVIINIVVALKPRVLQLLDKIDGIDDPDY